MGSSGGSKYGNFGGYMFTPGPLVYENRAYRVQKTWNEVNSYRSVYGTTNGSTYFRFLDIGKSFDSRGSSFSSSSGSIDNANPMSFDEYDDWGIPTQSALKMLISTTRNGSTVNGNTKKHYSRITTNITYAGQSNMGGYLFFPDDEIITGKTLSVFDSYTKAASNVSSDELNEYLNQGCIFLPFAGSYTGSWRYGGSSCNIISATGNNSTVTYGISASDSYLGTYDLAKSNEYTIIYLCRKIPKPTPPLKSFGGLYFTPGPLVYDGSNFQVQPYWNEINSYNSKSGLTAGSTYFSYSNISSLSSLSWKNKNWRVPTQNEFKKLVGTDSGYTRNGSTVNGNTGKHYSIIQTNITYATASNMKGYIFFPDDQTITGDISFSYFDDYDFSTFAATGVTESQLDNYISQGCLFMPFSGANMSGWSNLNNYGYSWTNSSGKNFIYGLYEMGITGLNNTYSTPVILCTDAT